MRLFGFYLGVYVLGLINVYLAVGDLLFCLILRCICVECLLCCCLYLLLLLLCYGNVRIYLSISLLWFLFVLLRCLFDFNWFIVFGVTWFVCLFVYCSSVLRFGLWYSMDGLTFVLLIIVLLYCYIWVMYSCVLIFNLGLVYDCVVCWFVVLGCLLFTVRWGCIILFTLFFLLVCWLWVLLVTFVGGCLISCVFVGIVAFVSCLFDCWYLAWFCTWVRIFALAVVLELFGGLFDFIKCVCWFCLLCCLVWILLFAWHVCGLLEILIIVLFVYVIF